MLRHETPCINHAHADLIVQLACERPADDLKGPSPIMAQQVLHILKQESPWQMMLDDPGYIIGEGEGRR